MSRLKCFAYYFESGPKIRCGLFVDCGYFMFFFCLAFTMPLCVSVYMCLVVTCWERADLLALVGGV